MNARTELRGFEFEQLVQNVLPRILGPGQLEREPRLSSRLRPDFVFRGADGKTSIIEAKVVTPSTVPRLHGTVSQLQQMGEAAVTTLAPRSAIELILVVSDTLSREYTAYLSDAGIRVIDGPALREAGADVPRSYLLATPEREAPEEDRETAEALLAALGALAPGRQDAYRYQALVGSVLSFLFCPPLEQPISESPNVAKVNRRDFVLPNYAEAGFWGFVRTAYSADYVVVEAKNYVRDVKKNEVLQLANYLAEHGTGLFGLIVCREAHDRSAEFTRRETWMVHRKLMLVVNDNDLRQMITMKTTGTDPAELLRQKIEDFRLGF